MKASVWPLENRAAPQSDLWVPITVWNKARMVRETGLAHLGVIIFLIDRGQGQIVVEHVEPEELVPIVSERTIEPLASAGAEKPQSSCPSRFLSPNRKITVSKLVVGGM